MALSVEQKVKEAFKIMFKQYPGVDQLDKAPFKTLVVGVLADNNTIAKAQKAYNELARHFVDFNEIRVTRDMEMAAHLPDLRSVSTVSFRLRQVLNVLFEEVGKLDLSYLSDKTSAELKKELAPIADVSEFAAMLVQLVCFHQDVLPVDTTMERVAHRLEIITGGAGIAKLQKLLQDSFATNNYLRLVYAMQKHGDVCCTDKDPKCLKCPLKALCHYPERLVQAKEKVAKEAAKQAAQVLAKKQVEAKAAAKKAAEKVASAKGKTPVPASKSKVSGKTPAPQVLEKKSVGTHVVHPVKEVKKTPPKVATPPHKSAAKVPEKKSTGKHVTPPAKAVKKTTAKIVTPPHKSAAKVPEKKSAGKHVAPPAKEVKKTIAKVATPPHKSAAKVPEKKSAGKHVAPPAKSVKKESAKVSKKVQKPVSSKALVKKSPQATTSKKASKPVSVKTIVKNKAKKPVAKSPVKKAPPAKVAPAKKVSAKVPAAKSKISPVKAKKAPPKGKRK